MSVLRVLTGSDKLSYINFIVTGNKKESTKRKPKQTCNYN